MISNQIRMCEFYEHILKRPAALSEFAHHPVPISGQPKDRFPHIDSRLHTQREFLPIILSIGNHFPNA